MDPGLKSLEVMQNKFQAYCKVSTSRLSNLARYFSGLATIPQSKLVLHGGVFLATSLATLKKEVHCKLQKTYYTLQFRAATCNGFKIIHVIIAESRTELYFVQSLQVQKNCETRFKDGMFYFLQRTCNLPRNEIATRVAKKIALCKGGFSLMTEITRILAVNVRRQFFFVITTTTSTHCLVQNFQLICHMQRVNAKSQYNDSGSSRCSKWSNDRIVAVVKHCWLLVQGRSGCRER